MMRMMINMLLWWLLEARGYLLPTGNVRNFSFLVG